MSSVAGAFAGLRSALESQKIRYAIGGSWASTAFGAPRFTNGVDTLVDLNPASLERFLDVLPTTYYVDPDNARDAISRGRPFNVIYMPAAFKFDLFPAAAYALGSGELDRAILVSGTGLSQLPTPFVTPEDVLLAKLHWYALGGETSQVQWRDIQGIVEAQGASLDRQYLDQGAAELNISRLLRRALPGA